MDAEVSNWTGLRTKTKLSQEQDPEEVAELRSELHQNTGENTDQEVQAVPSCVLNRALMDMRSSAFGLLRSPCSGKLMRQPEGLPEPEVCQVLQAGQGKILTTTNQILFLCQLPGEGLPISKGRHSVNAGLTPKEG